MPCVIWYGRFFFARPHLRRLHYRRCVSIPSPENKRCCAMPWPFLWIAGLVLFIEPEREEEENPIFFGFVSGLGPVQVGSTHLRKPTSKASAERNWYSCWHQQKASRWCQHIYTVKGCLTKSKVENCFRDILTICSPIWDLFEPTDSLRVDLRDCGRRLAVQ